MDYCPAGFSQDKKKDVLSTLQHIYLPFSASSSEKCKNEVKNNIFKLF